MSGTRPRSDDLYFDARTPVASRHADRAVRACGRLHWCAGRRGQPTCAPRGSSRRAAGHLVDRRCQPRLVRAGRRDRCPAAFCAASPPGLYAARPGDRLGAAPARHTPGSASAPDSVKRAGAPVGADCAGDFHRWPAERGAHAARSAALRRAIAQLADGVGCHRRLARSDVSRTIGQVDCAHRRPLGSHRHRPIRPAGRPGSAPVVGAATVRLPHRPRRAALHPR